MRITKETFVDGSALSNMSIDNILHNVKALKAEIEDLTTANEGVDSKNIATMIAKKAGQLGQLAEFLDGKKLDNNS